MSDKDVFFHLFSSFSWSITLCVYLSTPIGALEYADDICLLSQITTRLQDNLNSLRTNAITAGLEININKTKVMAGGYGANSSPAIMLHDIRVECVGSFNYLGSLVSAKGGVELDIDARISKVKSMFGMLRSIWKSQ